jgi:hypothetical protein
LSAAEHDESEMYRLIVLSRSGAEVLLVPDGSRYRLPEAVIPRWQRIAEEITSAVRNEWGEEVVCLFTLGCTPAERAANGIHYQVAEHSGTSGTPRSPIHWVPLSALSPDGFADRFDYSVLERSISEIRSEVRQISGGQFGRLGWFRELFEWVEGVAEAQGFRLKGNFRQFNASPTFSLIRFETDRAALWFKAVGEPNQREFPITCLLTKLFPDYLPPILADRPDWNGWLTQEVEGINLGETRECALWETAASALAELQIRSVRTGGEILAADAHDLRVAFLSRLVQPLMGTMASLMDRQTKIPPSILSRGELALLGKRIQEAFEVLDDLGIPDTVGHLDLNPWNIIVAPGRCAFLDWAEAYVGNPFFSMQYLVEHLRRVFGTDSAVEARLVESYCAPWKQVIPSPAIDEALSLASLLAVFSYAAVASFWQDGERLQDPATAGYLRSLARRMHREANLLADRSELCPR